MVLITTVTVKEGWGSWEVQCLCQKLLSFLWPRAPRIRIKLSGVCSELCTWPGHLPPSSAPGSPPCHMALASAETTALEGKESWLDPLIIWIWIQETLGSKDKPSENDDLASALQCIDAGTWRGKASHLLLKISFLKLIFGWLCIQFAKCSNIQIGSERQALALGNIDVFFMFQTFNPNQLIPSGKRAGVQLWLFWRQGMESERGLVMT